MIDRFFSLALAAPLPPSLLATQLLGDIIEIKNAHWSAYLAAVTSCYIGSIRPTPLALFGPWIEF
jgi:hypothetical protein